MASGNTKTRRPQDPGSTSENRGAPPRPRPGGRPTALAGLYAAVLDDYAAALAGAPIAPESRRTYLSKVRQYLAWLADAAVDGDPLTTPAARDWAVRDYRAHLQAVAKRAPRTVNNALAAVDDFYTRRGLGAANATRADLPKSAPRALSRRTAVRFLRAVEQRPSPRDQALALIPFYAGARIAETVGLDVDDVKISARKGTLRILGKGEKIREVPLHPALRAVLADWLAERGDWPGAHGAALFLNQRGGRLSARGAGDIITAIATDAHLDGEGVSAHPLRHTFVTTLVRGGTDLVTVAELAGHARLETTRAYSLPTDEDKTKALNLLITDQ